MALNSCSFSGRFVRDPEGRTTQSGVNCCLFTLAVDRDFKDKNTGERQTDFINFVAWRNTAEFICRYFHKGDMAIVASRCTVRPYTDKDGNNRTATEFVVDNCYFGGSNSRAEGSNASYQPAPRPAEFTDDLSDDGDLPF